MQNIYNHEKRKNIRLDSIINNAIFFDNAIANSRLYMCKKP